MFYNKDQKRILVIGAGKTGKEIVGEMIREKDPGINYMSVSANAVTLMTGKKDRVLIECRDQEKEEEKP